MRVFRIQVIDSEEPYHYEGTQSAAHKYAKELPKHQWEQAKITELDVQTDKEGILALMNDDPIITDTGPSFGLTKRGGLKPWVE